MIGSAELLGKLMQVHEITQQPVNEGLRDIAAAIKNPIAAAKATTQGAPGTSLSSRIAAVKADKKIKDLADRTYNAWKNYIYRVEQNLDPKDLPAFRNRSDGRYRKDLEAWVNANLSRGLYLPNSTNAGQINTVMNQLSGTVQQPPAQTQQQTTPQQQTQQRPQQNPAVNAVRNSQPISIGGQTIQPGTPQYQQIAQRLSGLIPENINEAISQSQEKTLWLQLITLITLAQQDVQRQQQQQQAAAQAQPATSQQYAQLIQQLLANQGISQSTTGTLKTVLANINQQGQNVRSTGNPTTDGLLRLLGFSII